MPSCPRAFVSNVKTVCHGVRPLPRIMRRGSMLEVSSTPSQSASGTETESYWNACNAPAKTDGGAPQCLHACSPGEISCPTTPPISSTWVTRSRRTSVLVAPGTVAIKPPSVISSTCQPESSPRKYAAAREQAVPTEGRLHHSQSLETSMDSDTELPYLGVSNTA